MSRRRTALTAFLLVIPMIAGGFLLQEPPARSSSRLFEQVLSLVSRQYVDSIDTGDIMARAASGLVRELQDPFTELLTPRESESFARGTNGRYGGTGMLLEEDADGVVSVQRVFPNTPADDAGVREGDRITAIGDSDATTWGLSRVSENLRGREGTVVAVSFARSGVAQPIRLTFTRRQVHIPAVPYSGVFRDAVYVPLQTFNENSIDEVKAAVTGGIASGARGIVLDMRDNGGGILEQALGIASLFLEDGQEILRVRARGTEDEVLRASGERIARGVPIIVLTNAGTASAAEIVAGALQDHDRAVVMGATSFGKGLVQSVYSLHGGYALKLTTGKWYTPSGRSINRERRVMEDGSVREGRMLDGRIVEGIEDSVETETMRARRPQFRTSAGRVVYGGGGIVPDVLVMEDSISPIEVDFLRSIATRGQQLRNVLQQYSLVLRDSVARGFDLAPRWRTELRRRLDAAGVAIAPRFDSVASALLADELARRVTRRAFGDAAAKERTLDEDRALVDAIALLRRSPDTAALLRAAASTKS